MTLLIIVSVIAVAGIVVSIVSNIVHMAENQRLLQEIQELSQYQGIVDTQKYVNKLLYDAEGKHNVIITTAKLQADELLYNERNALKEREKRVEELEQINRTIQNKAQLEATNILNSAEKEVEQKKRLLNQLQEQVDNAYKEYHYRKTLPDTHEKLKAKFADLKVKCEQLTEGIKTAKAAGKESALSSKEREKILNQFDKLAQAYIDVNYRFAVSKMTSNNFPASRDNVLKSINFCRTLVPELEIAFDAAFEEKYVEKVREEFRKILRIEEMRMEQQRIKEQIREETKSQNRIEALKKQEEKLRRNLEYIEQERAIQQRAINEALQKTHGEYTARIREMQRDIEDKDKELAAQQQEIEDNQRAISNAQITKVGYVYVLSNIGSFGEGTFKIGMTRRDDPQERVDELSRAAVPFPFDVHLMVGTDNAPELEKMLHKKFNDKRVNRVNLRKEFFQVDVDDIQREIESFLGKSVDYRADPHVLEEYAVQYHQSQQTTLADIWEVDSLYEEAGIDPDDEMY